MLKPTSNPHLFQISKAMELDDVTAIPQEASLVSLAEQKFWEVPHPARRWEYAIAMHLVGCARIMQDGKPLDVLDVGGNESLLPVALADQGNKVVVADPRPAHYPHVDLSSGNLLTNFRYVPHEANHKVFDGEEFDVVLCISVLEHVPDWRAVLAGIAQRVKAQGVLLLSFDFHPSGERLVPDHLRTFNKDKVLEIVKYMKELQFEVVEGLGDYDHHKNNVEFGGQSYNFASICFYKDSPLPKISDSEMAEVLSEQDGDEEEGSVVDLDSDEMQVEDIPLETEVAREDDEEDEYEPEDTDTEDPEEPEKELEI